MRSKFALLFLAIFSLASCTHATTKVSAERIVATPAPPPRVSVSIELPTPTAVPAKKVVPAKPVAPKVEATDLAAPKVLSVPTVGLDAFRGLGSWIDVFDYTDDPSTVVPLVKGMAARGVRTLYLETSRYQSATDIQFPHALGAALDEAKAQGMRVVAWYPPAFDDVNRDVRRSIAAINFKSPQARRFDAFAADIEYTQNVPDHNERSKRAVAYSERLRAGSGGMHLAAITIAPTSLEVRPDRWPDFPWKALSSLYDVFMPMNYWTGRGANPDNASTLTTENVQKERALTGRPVHIIGGLGEQTDTAQAKAYVDAARKAGSIGGGLYDFKTTKDEVWGELRRLN